MCVLSDMGDEGRPFGGKGGGVMDRARGLLGLDGDGDKTGDDAPFVRLPLAKANPASSSEGALGSSSFSNEETKGAPSLTGGVSPFDSGGIAAEPAAGPAAGGAADELEATAGCVGIRLVRGRFNLRSGSCTGSAGEAVTERVFRFRLAVEVEGPASASRATSSAPQARFSSLVSSTIGAAGWRCSLICGGMLLRKTSRAPRRWAMFMRCCHLWSSARSSCWNRRNCSISSSSSSKLSRSTSLKS